MITIKIIIFNVHTIKIVLTLSSLYLLNLFYSDTGRKTHLRMSLSKSANFDQAQSVVPCDVCDTETGEHYCTVCRQTLCDGCEKFHKKVASTKDHEVVPRVQMPSVVASTSCIRHPDQTVSLQCGRCQVLVCIKCVTSEHSGHRMKELSSIYEIEKDKEEKRIWEMEHKTIPSLRQRMEETDSKRKNYGKVIAGIRQEMDNEIKGLKTRLDRIHTYRLQRLAVEEDTGKTEFDHVQRNFETQIRAHTEDVAICKTKIASGNIVDFLAYSQDKSSKKRILLDPVRCPSPPQLSQPKTQIDDISTLLSVLNISPNTNVTKQICDPQIISSFKSRFENGQSICLTVDAKAWVGGFQSYGLELMDGTGNVLENRKTTYRTNAMAITSSGDIILIPRKEDSTKVIKLRIDGTESPILEASPSYAKGVSVTVNDDILISMVDGRLMRCGVNGEDIRKLYDGKKKNSVAHAIELQNGNISISDAADNALVIINKNGKVLNKIMKPLGVKGYSPWGMACDRMNNILSVDEDNDRIYIINQKREVRELVGKTHQIGKPLWLALDRDDNLWITQNDGNIKVVKYMA